MVALGSKKVHPAGAARGAKPDTACGSTHRKALGPPREGQVSILAVLCCLTSTDNIGFAVRALDWPLVGR